MLEWLRPKPFRGDQIAAGVVVLVVLTGLLSIRFAGHWAPGTHLVIAAATLAFVTALAVLTPLPERQRPASNQRVLYVSCFVLGALTLAWLGEVAHSSVRTTLVWAPALLGGQQLFFAVARRSPAGTLLASVSITVTVVALVAEVSGGDVQAVRWALVALIAAHALTAVGQRDRRPAHAAQLANSGGLAALAIAIPGLVEPLGADVPLSDPAGEIRLLGAGWGWELVVLAAGFGLVSYGAVDHERGPIVLGVVDLVAFVLLAAVDGEDPSLLGWPLALALAAGLLLVTGLRPTTPAPPPPDRDGEVASTVRLQPRGEPEI